MQETKTQRGSVLNSSNLIHFNHYTYAGNTEMCLLTPHIFDNLLVCNEKLMLWIFIGVHVSLVTILLPPTGHSGHTAAQHILHPIQEPSSHSGVPARFRDGHVSNRTLV